MLNRSCWFFGRCLAGVVALGVASFSGSSARAQATAGTEPQTKFDRFISHFDLGVSATGEFATNASGNVVTSVSPANSSPLTIHPSTTVGVLATIRAQRSAWVGGEFNFRYARYDQTFTYANQPSLNFSSQNTANEFTLGYLARPEHPVGGFAPFLSLGAGTTEFKPTRGSATGLPVQARATYYYSVGGDRYLVGDTLGLRLGFRETFYLAPDFGQNYLEIKKLQTSLEPTIGFYLHF